MKKVIILYLLSLSFMTRGQSTAMFHGGDGPCGVYAGGGEYKPLGDVKWKFQTRGKVFSSPAVVNGVTYVGSEDGYLYAIQSETGKLRWKFKTGGAVHSSPAVIDHSVYFGSFDGHYYAVDVRTGKERWRVRTGVEQWMGGVGYLGFKPNDKRHNDPWDFFLSSPAFNKSENDSITLYFGSSDGNLYAVDPGNGKVRWKFSTGGSIHTTPAIDGETVYVGSWDAVMYAVDTKTGKLRWKFNTGTTMGMTGIQASPVIHDGRPYFGARDAKFYCLDARTGDRVWEYDAENSWVISTATIKDGVVYMGTSDTFLLLGLDAETGKEKLRFKTDGYVYGSPAISGNTVYFGDFTGKFYALDLTSKEKTFNTYVTPGRVQYGAQVLNDGKLDFQKAAEGKDLSEYASNVDVMNRFYSLGAIVSSPVVKDNVVYVGSADGNVYAIRLRE